MIWVIHQVFSCIKRKNQIVASTLFIFMWQDSGILRGGHLNFNNMTGFLKFGELNSSCSSGTVDRFVDPVEEAELTKTPSDPTALTSNSGISHGFEDDARVCVRTCAVAWGVGGGGVGGGRC